MEFKKSTTKKATILISDIIFLVLALSFITILIVFISRQTSNTILIEEQTAKQLALTLDAMPEKTQLTIFLGNVLKEKEKGFSGEVIKINNERNVVMVRLGVKSGYEYSFFNNLFFTSELKGDYLIIESK